MARHSAKTHHFNSIRTLTALPSLLTLCLLFMTARASASLPDSYGVNLTSIAAAPNGGFWVQVDDYSNGGGAGHTVAIDGAPQFENVPARGTIAAIPGRGGYWVVTQAGRIYSRGDAPTLCDSQLSDCSGFPRDPEPGQWVVAVASTPDGLGFWAVTADGKVFTAGNAVSYGDVTNDRQTPTGIVATPSGRGYYIVLEDGGVYSFGDAVFHGSTGGKKPGGHSVTGLAASLDLLGNINGYWMVAADGGVFTYGDAPFLGSSGGNDRGSPITGIIAQPAGRSYAWVHGNGQVDRSQEIPSVTINSAIFGTAWDLPNGNMEPGTLIKLMGPDGDASQEWDIWPTSKDGLIVQLVNVNSGLCADLSGSTVIQWQCKGKDQGWDNQRFILVHDGEYTEFEPFSQRSYRVAAQGPQQGAGLFLIYQDPSILSTAWRITPVQ
jgi:hypothetical protein